MGRVAIALLFMTGIAHAGDDPKALLDSGAAFERAGEWDLARHVYEKLEHVDGHAGEALYLQAKMAFESGDDVVALALAERAAHAHHAPARMLYADVLYHQGEYRRAKDMYLELQNGAGSMRDAATRKLAACDRALGIAVVVPPIASPQPPATHVPAPVPDHAPDQLMRDAKALEDAGNWEDARAIYLKLEKNPAFAGRAYYRDAWSAFQMSDTSDAIALAQKAATMPGPQRDDARVLIGDALFRQGDYHRARDIYIGIRKAATSSEVRSMLAKKITAANRVLQLPERDGIE